MDNSEEGCGSSLPSWERRLILAAIYVEGDRLLRAVLPPQLAERDARGGRCCLLPLHPAFLPPSPLCRGGQREPRGVQTEGWSRRSWLLGAGSKAGCRRRHWWNKRLMEKRGKETRQGARDAGETVGEGTEKGQWDRNTKSTVQDFSSPD